MLAHKSFIQVRRGHEFIMSSQRHDAAMIHNGNLIRTADRGHPVRNRECRAIFRQLFDGVQQESLGLGIECRRGLIKDQDRRVLKQCPGDRQSLLLAHR